MGLFSSDIDERHFDELMGAAREHIRARCPAWTDLSEGDPGIVLLEVYAHLTELMIHRLNRLPEKAYAEFLMLMGVKRLPSVAAEVMLEFSVAEELPAAVEIPPGTEVATERPPSGGEPPTFVTVQRGVIEPGETSVSLLAVHAESVEGHLLGLGTGEPGQVFTLEHVPVVAPTGRFATFELGVELQDEERDVNARIRVFEGRRFEIWDEVENFVGPSSAVRSYLLDRVSGRVTFAPAYFSRAGDGAGPGSAALPAPEVPPSGREIRIWFRRGGGAGGNVAAGTLVVMKDVLPGVSVINPLAAFGGREAEGLENALIRGPEEVHSRNRAVTARDYEVLALRSGAVARAKAFTEASEWCYAPPGNVAVIVVPALATDTGKGGPGISIPELKKRQSDEALQAILENIDERRPLGTRCKVEWVRFKEFHVKARVVIHGGEDPDEVRAGIHAKLNRMTSPLPTQVGADRQPGWRFGESLRVSDVYDAILREPGVRYAEDVRLFHGEVPAEDVTSLALDKFQPGCWWAGGGNFIYRSLSNGSGWELIHSANEGGEIVAIESNEFVPGMLAAASSDRESGEVLVSADCGQFWHSVANFPCRVEDLAWVSDESGSAVLVVATGQGLYKLGLGGDYSLTGIDGPTLIPVDPENPTTGFYSVTAMKSYRGMTSIAAAAMQTGGIYLSGDKPLSGTYEQVGLSGEDVRRLLSFGLGSRLFLIAGAYARGTSAGTGCKVMEILPNGKATSKWNLLAKGWTGGSCRAMAVCGDLLVAGTHRSGVLWCALTAKTLSGSKGEGTWSVPDLERSGLPVRAAADFAMRPINAIAAGSSPLVVMAGTQEGVFRSMAGVEEYAACSRKENINQISLPSTWLFCPGAHEIDVTEG